MSTPATTERLAGLLDRHLSDSEFESGCRLSCGYEGDDRVAHIAAALQAAGVGFVAEAQAEALREAADDWIGGEWRPVNFNRAGRDEHPGARQARWLRERADRIGGAS